MYFNNVNDYWIVKSMKVLKFLFQGQCAYSDQAQREGCQAKDFFSFTCPNNPEQLNAHPRYPDPTGILSQ